jgi:hypothetical protein
MNRPCAELLLVLLLATGWSIVAPQARAEDPQAIPPRQIVTVISGRISGKHVLALHAALELMDPNGHSVGPLLLLLDSLGGDGLAAMELGRMARAARARAYVTGRCASACMLILAGCVVRHAADRTVGIHSGAVERFEQDKGLVEIDPRSDDSAKHTLDEGYEELTKYLDEMGMTPALYRAMRAVPFQQVKWLSAKEMEMLGVVGTDPTYGEALVRASAQAYGISEDRFVRRSESVLRWCAAVKSRPADFVACHDEVLRTGRAVLR